MSKLRGVSGARKRAKQRPDALGGFVNVAISETVNAVHHAGRANIDAMVKRRRGVLRRRYSKTVRKPVFTGFVGYITAKSRRAAFYARFVHDGTKTATARPFHDLAVAEQERRHSQRMRGALKKSISASGPSGLARTGRGKVRGL